MVCLEYINFEHNTVAAELVRQTYDTPPLAFVHSYGCQQNVNDGERIKGVLVDIGYGLCDKPEDADLILFNTCAVREHAEQRVFGNVGALKGLKEKKPGLIIGLCGCMANQKHVVEKLRKSYPYVDLVFGVDGIDTLPQLIAQKLQKHKRVLLDPAQRPVIVENIPIRRESEFRAWLPIMYGCDNFCTYCIIPFARGPVRSLPMDQAVAQTRQLQAEGYRELVFTGIEISSWGQDLHNGTGLIDLMEAVAAAAPRLRLRLGSLEPRTITEDFCRRAAGEGTLCALRLWNIGGRDRRNGEVLDFLSRRLGGDVLALPTDRRGNRRLAEHIFLEQAEKFDWPDPEAPESGTEFCHGLRQQLAVLWDGTVVPCCLDGDGRMALGNLYTSSVEEILASPRAAAIREGFSRRQPSEELCRRCGYAARF